MASEGLHDPSFPFPPAKRRRIGSTQHPSHIPLPPPTLLPTPTSRRGRPRRQSTPLPTTSRLRGRPHTLPTPVTALHGPRGRPRERPLQPFEGALSLGFISEFHNVPAACRVHDLGAMDIECDKCHALFWKEEVVPFSDPKEQPNFL
jgi:hypothetical protein